MNKLTNSIGIPFSVAGNPNYAAYLTPTDLYVLVNAAGSGKNLYVHRATLSAAATAAATGDVVVTVRSGSYAATANNLNARISNWSGGAQTSIAQCYEITASPSTPGTTTGFVGLKRVAFGTLAGAGSVPTVFDFSVYDNTPILIPQNGILAFSFNGAALPAGAAFSFEIVWSEGL